MHVERERILTIYLRITRILILKYLLFGKIFQTEMINKNFSLRLLKKREKRLGKIYCYKLTNNWADNLYE